MIYTDEQIEAMTREEAIKAWKTERLLLENIERKCKRLEDILNAVGIAYEAYERSYKQGSGYGGIG